MHTCVKQMRPHCVHTQSPEKFWKAQNDPQVCVCVCARARMRTLAAACKNAFSRLALEHTAQQRCVYHPRERDGGRGVGV